MISCRDRCEEFWSKSDTFRVFDSFRSFFKQASEKKKWRHEEIANDEIPNDHIQNLKFWSLTYLDQP